MSGPRDDKYDDNEWAENWSNEDWSGDWSGPHHDERTDEWAVDADAHASPEVEKSSEASDLSSSEKGNEDSTETGLIPQVPAHDDWHSSYEQQSAPYSTEQVPPYQQGYPQQPYGAPTSQGAPYSAEGKSDEKKTNGWLIGFIIALIFVIIVVAAFFVVRIVKTVGDDDEDATVAAPPTSSEMTTSSEYTTTSSEETSTSETTSEASVSRNYPSRSSIHIPSEAVEVDDNGYSGFQIYRIPPRGSKHGASEELSRNIAATMADEIDSDSNWALHDVTGTNGAKYEVDCNLDGSGVGWLCTAGVGARVYLIKPID
ncbi:hypothetical protein L1O03_08140 [Corynebacterium uropygiale]|uniref:Uncharacterized protein n=1 Tax=Corynebacterium uropygiale TaxID=1775911 RepID=A0A9X1QQY3_9CORY|nr:hypothetical protein [Corynebacterium uropygiale]MCF4007141.1 hypothetical protein [Corynebacterium uropygiale]